MRNQMNLFFVICLLYFPVLLTALQYRDCGSKKAKINSIALNDCQKLPCVIKKGTFANFSVSFTPSEEVTSGIMRVWGILKPLPPVPFPLDNDKLCKDTGVTCPIPAGKEVTYGNHMEVKTIYPSITVVNKWQAEDQNGDVLFCFEISLRLVN